MAAVESGEKYGYIDKKGNYVINPQFDYAFYFADNGLAVVKNDEKYGYIDKKGNYVINLQFDSASTFDDSGMALVKNSDQFGFIDKKGNYVINPQFDDVHEYSSYDKDLIAVETGDKYGCIDRKGNQVISGKDYIYQIYPDGIIFAQGKKAGVLKKDGTVLINCSYDGVGSYDSEKFCTNDDCYNYKSADSLYCYTHKPKTSSSSSYSTMPYCDFYGCLNRVEYSWNDYCTEHSFMED